MFEKYVDDNNWTFMENPIYDMSREGSFDLEKFGILIENPIYEMSTEERFFIDFRSPWYGRGAFQFFILSFRAILLRAAHKY